MGNLATVETKKSVTKFINSLKDKTKREDSKQLVNIIKKITGKPPKIWGNNFIIGFGKYTYTRKNSKDEFEWFHVGFAPRKTNITLYLTCDIAKEQALLKKLGKCTWGKGCLYIKSLEDVDIAVLKKLIAKYKDSSWF